MKEQDRVEEWLNRRRLVLDLAELTGEERAEGSTLLGGSGAEFVSLDDQFENNQVSRVVFNWGDDRLESIIARLLEHDDAPDEDLIPFNLSTIIGDYVWSLTIQDSDYDPNEKFEKPSGYIVIPYDKVEGIIALQKSLSLPTPRPEQIVKIGLRWFAFGPGTNIRNSENSLIEQVEEIKPKNEFSKEDVIILLKHLVDNWDFDHQETDNSYNFTTHITHWVLETFGQKSNAGEFVLYPHGDNFDGDELPIGLRSLLTHTWQDELFVTRDNSISLQTQHEFVETDSFIPEYDYIKTLPTFVEQLQYVRDHPEIKAGIKPTVAEVLPQVRMIFKPQFSYGWGIEFLVSQSGIRITPFGDAGNTEVPFRYIVDNLDNHSEMARIVCNLAILGAQHTIPFARDHNFYDDVELLSDRLNGRADIPLCASKFDRRSSSAMKNLLIDTILGEDSEES